MKYRWFKRGFVMKKKISLRLSEAIVDELKTVAEERGVNRAVIVEKALARFLSEPHDDTAPAGCCERIDDQLKSIQRELKAVNETVALHARYHLAVTSLMQQGRGEPSLMSNLAEVAERGANELAPRTPTYPIDDRHAVSSGDSADDDGIERPFGAPTRRTGGRPWASAIPVVGWGLPDVAGEGGNEDYFRGPPR
jgi:predicted DNA-binding protein